MQRSRRLNPRGGCNQRVDSIPVDEINYFLQSDGLHFPVTPEVASYTNKTHATSTLFLPTRTHLRSQVSKYSKTVVMSLYPFCRLFSGVIFLAMKNTVDILVHVRTRTPKLSDSLENTPYNSRFFIYCKKPSIHPQRKVSPCE